MDHFLVCLAHGPSRSWTQYVARPVPHFFSSTLVCLAHIPLSTDSCHGPPLMDLFSMSLPSFNFFDARLSCLLAPSLFHRPLCYNPSCRSTPLDYTSLRILVRVDCAQPRSTDDTQCITVMFSPQLPSHRLSQVQPFFLDNPAMHAVRLTPLVSHGVR